jgi:hypothetical protein
MLCARGFKLVKFADPLKEMLRVIGLGPEELEGQRKGLPCKLLLGRSPRHAMQTLGTEWGRHQIAEELWCDIFRRRAKQWLLDGHPVVTDDCRFENEVKVVRDLGGEIWRVSRQGLKPIPGSHPSEAGIASRFASVHVRNDSDIAALAVTVALLLEAGK